MTAVNVAVPPRWLVEPRDTSVERTRHAVLDCQAQGVPPPVVVWKKASGNLVIALGLVVARMIVHNTNLARS